MIKTKTARSPNNKVMPGPQLVGATRCPFCNVVDPLLERVWATDTPTERADGEKSTWWAAYKCKTCGSVMSVSAKHLGDWFSIEHAYPEPKQAHGDIPEPARTYLQQAYETLHAPDAAAVMAGSAVDAMLKKHQLTEGSLYTRIDEALKLNILTQGMADWAHEVRLGSNRPRHADSDNPHVSAKEAEQSVEFAEALGNFLFVLTARIERGIEAAKAADTPPANEAG